MTQVQKKMGTKRTKMMVSAAVLLSLGVGATYSWFTDETPTTQQEISMGTLKIQGTTEPIPGMEYTNKSPGEVVQFNTKVKNNGSLPVIVKATVEDVTGTQPVTIDQVGVTLEPTQFPTADSDGYFWYVDTTHPENKYLVILPNAEAVGSNLNITFDGDTMGNEYQEAEFNQAINSNATQLIAGAIEKEFGADYNNFEKYTGTTRASQEEIKQGKVMLERLMKK